MKIKTSELTGATLDWAVAKAEGMLAEPWLWGDEAEVVLRYKFSTDWSQGGPIIERMAQGRMVVESYGKNGVHVRLPEIEAHGYGINLLTASMRCYVASKLGDEVDVPEELV